MQAEGQLDVSKQLNPCSRSYEKFAEMIDRHWGWIAAYCKLDNKAKGFVASLNNKIRVIQQRTNRATRSFRGLRSRLAC